LKNWYDSLPPSFKISQARNPTYSEAQSTRGLSEAPLQFAYLIAEVFVYRALLRPLERSRHQAASSQAEANDTRTAAGNENIETHATHDYTGFSSQQSSEIDHAILSTVSAAENCAKLVLSFTSRLESRDFMGFWYSCKPTPPHDNLHRKISLTLRA
jgi:hypothetical protein